MVRLSKYIRLQQNIKDQINLLVYGAPQQHRKWAREQLTIHPCRPLLWHTYHTWSGHMEVRYYNYWPAIQSASQRRRPLNDSRARKTS